MRSNYCFVFITFLSLFTCQAHAMWKLKEIVLKENPQSWFDPYLENKDFIGFLEEADKRQINPNSVTSYLGTTPLEVACAYDQTGGTIKKLLTYGGIKKTYIDMVWDVLMVVAQAKNWHVFDIFIFTSNIELSYEDMKYITEQRPIEF
jgi:hypothetical protein